jgi:hypothetical protein
VTSHYTIEPEVAGGWGEQTEFTRKPGCPVVVHKLHYEFDGWLGDELLESTPCFIVTERMLTNLQQARLTGFNVHELLVSKSDQFDELHPDRTLPPFVWLEIVGEPGADDFGISPDGRLVVSDRALTVLREIGIANAGVEPFDAGAAQ